MKSLSSVRVSNLADGDKQLSCTKILIDSFCINFYSPMTSNSIRQILQ